MSEESEASLRDGYLLRDEGYLHLASVSSVRVGRRSQDPILRVRVEGSLDLFRVERTFLF